MGWAAEHLYRIERERLFEEILSSAGRRVIETTSGGDNLVCRCPLPGHEDKNPSFGYNVVKDVYNCARCGGGDLVRLYALVMGMSEADALKDLSERFKRDDTQPAGGKETQTRSSPDSDKEVPAAELEKMPPLPESWIKKLEARRGWSPSVIKHLDLRLWVPPTWFTDQTKRIAIPIYDKDGSLRNIRLYRPGGGIKNKVISYWTGAKSTKISYGQPARLWPALPPKDLDTDTTWLIEGEPDCICALSHGLNGETATGGAGTWRKSWTGRFRDRHVVICYDADLAGIIGACKVAADLVKVAASVRILVWPIEMADADKGEDSDSDAVLRAKAFKLAPNTLSVYISRLPSSHGQDLTEYFMQHG